MIDQSRNNRFVLAVAAMLASGISCNVLAQTQWEKDHPRRTEVNKRAENQNARIRQERKEGEITKAQAQQLHKEDHAIRQQERADAAKHGGHITKGEQRQLNKEENAVSRQIGK